MIVGNGCFRYRVVDDWARIPPGMELREVADIAIDSRGRVFVFNRGTHPVAVFDKSGDFLFAWGQGMFTSPHGMSIAPDDTLLLADDGGHWVGKFTLDGELLFALGERDKPSPFMSNKPFNRCTKAVQAPWGEIFVADGYANASVHVFSQAGDYIRSWGRCGIGRGEFNVVHSLCCDSNGLIYVAERENHRIQIFDRDGTYLREWNYIHRPCGMHMHGITNPIFFIGELCPAVPINHDFPNLGPRISVLDAQGAVLARIGDGAFGFGAGQFVGPHGLAVDAAGDVYVGEVPLSQWHFFHPEMPPPENLPCLRKLIRVDD